MRTTCNVLISSAGRRVALMGCFRQALTSLGLAGRVLAADMSALSSAFHAADSGFLVPPCADAGFIPRIFEICRREEVSLIIPTIDPELPVYAGNREMFDEVGCKVVISDVRTIEVSGNKIATHRWLISKGFPTVRQGSVEEVLTSPGNWQFPLITKPVHGSASLGLARVRGSEELRLATRGGGFVVQEIAPGREYTIDVFVDAMGRARCAVPRLRLEVRAGEVSKGMTVHNGPLEKLAMRLCEALPGARGVITVQVFLDERTGEMNVIEINPRFGGGFPLACRAGAHYPRWILEEHISLPVTARNEGWRDGLVMLRYDDAVFVDASDVGLR